MSAIPNLNFKNILHNLYAQIYLKTYLILNSNKML